GKFEADLVVAFAGAAVGEGVAARGQSDLHLLLGQQRAGNRRAEEILVLVDTTRADQFPEVLGDELLTHVFHIDFGRAGLASLVFEAGEFIAALSDVAANGDNFAAVIFFQPRNDDRSIEAARIGEGYFLRFRHKNSLLRGWPGGLPYKVINMSAFCAWRRF